MNLPDGTPGPDAIVCGVCGRRFKFFTREQGLLAIAHVERHEPMTDMALPQAAGKC